MKLQKQWGIQDFFGRTNILIRLASPWSATTVSALVKKICLSGVGEIVFLEPFLYGSCMSSLPSFSLSS